MQQPQPRLHKVVTVTIEKDANLSGEIDMAGYAGLLVHMPAEWTSASLGFKVAAGTGGTFLPLRDDDASLIQIDEPAISNAYQAPASIFGAGIVKLWSQTDSSNVAQGAARTLVMELKS